ncbi:MAG: hypothetical protein KDB23_11195, partial [Planctomycetales bacterium]|nr:hypothetical protein [Planctomycetales bacterium]
MLAVTRWLPLLALCTANLSPASADVVMEVKWSQQGSKPNPDGLLTHADITGIATAIDGFVSLSDIEPSRVTYTSSHSQVVEQMGSPLTSDSALVTFDGTDAEPATFHLLLDGELIATSSAPEFSLETDFTSSSFPSRWRTVIPITGVDGTEFYREVLELTDGRGDLQFVSDLTSGKSSTGRFGGTGRIVLGGDFNGDGNFNVADIHSLTDTLRGDRPIPAFDLDNSGRVDFADLDRFVHEYLHSWFGDANLDGEFNTGDLVQVFAVGEYEDTTI